MTGDEKKGRVSADIPADAVEEALRAVERSRSPEEPGGEVEARGEAGGEEGGGSAAPRAPEDAAAERDRLAAELELSQAKGRELMEKLRAEHDRMLRAAADLENHKKRAQRERDEVQRYGNERLVKDLIPVVDNLERALRAAPADDPLSGGVRLVLRQIEETLGRYGVVCYSALGQPFDPRLHEALMQVTTDEKPAGTVVVEHGRGFLLHERLVRPAMVGVAAPAGEGAPAAAEAAEGGEGD